MICLFYYINLEQRREESYWTRHKKEITMYLQLFVLVTIFAVGAFGEKADKYKKFILEKHNDYRRKQRGSNMNRLEWNDTLAHEANKWIARCNFEHQNTFWGENLAFNTNLDDIKTMESAFTSWYAEIKDYSYAGKSCATSASCHYTQLVWATTRTVGCAIKECPSLNAGWGNKVKNALYFGCWYDPKGNDAGEYPYLTGTPCNECWEGQTCDDGLCAGVGKQKCEDLHENCVMWEAMGECRRNEKFMKKNCRQACGFCEGGPKRECKDKSFDCDRYPINECERNEAWMKPNCMKKCGFCS